MEKNILGGWIAWQEECWTDSDMVSHDVGRVIYPSASQSPLLTKGCGWGKNLWSPTSSFLWFHETFIMHGITPQSFKMISCLQTQFKTCLTQISGSPDHFRLNGQWVSGCYPWALFPVITLCPISHSEILSMNGREGQWQAAYIEVTCMPFPK